MQDGQAGKAGRSGSLERRALAPVGARSFWITSTASSAPMIGARTK
jgi:hypothetical protein